MNTFPCTYYLIKESSAIKPSSLSEERTLFCYKTVTLEKSTMCQPEKKKKKAALTQTLLFPRIINLTEKKPILLSRAVNNGLCEVTCLTYNTDCSWSPQQHVSLVEKG